MLSVAAPVQISASARLFDEPPDGDLAALDHCLFHDRDHVIDHLFGQFDDRILVGDLDRADAPAFDAGLVGERADEVLRTHAGVAAGADVDAGGGATGAAVAVFARGAVRVRS